jgi:hypothetical protein
MRQARAREEADRRIEQVRRTNDQMERTNRYVPIEVPQNRPAPPPASGGYRPIAVPEIERSEYENVDFASCVSFFTILIRTTGWRSGTGAAKRSTGSIRRTWPVIWGLAAKAVPLKRRKK